MTTLNQLKARFDAAWKRATDEHGRLVLLHGYADAVPPEEWAEYNRLLAAAERIADEGGPVGSPEREAVVYGARR